MPQTNTHTDTEPLTLWESRFKEFFNGKKITDASHDLSHFQRVWGFAQKIIATEGNSCDKLVVLAACYFHDIVSFEKNDPRRSQSSLLAAEATVEILRDMKFPEDMLAKVHHAVHAHSFSAQVPPQTIEAKIVQDADRMEALGPIGIARCFYVSGRMQRPLFHPQDPLAKNRDLDDQNYALDHFSIKLLKLHETMTTEGGRTLAKARTEVVYQFMMDLADDVQPEA